MPVSSTQEQMLVQQLSDRVPGLPSILLQELANRSDPNVFLQQLRLLHRHASHVQRQRTSFLDDPCPMENELLHYDQTGSGSSSGEEEDVAMEEERDVGMPCVLPGPAPCSFLTVGQCFTGCQRLSSGGPARPSEDWQVSVWLQAVDLQSGYVCGVMEACHVPYTRSPIMTFWEGEIVDNTNHTFFTRKWGASSSTDLQHWSRFPGFSSEQRQQVSRHRGKCGQLDTSPCIFMRWKEAFFVNNNESCGLTIAGFYYVCLERQTGKLHGYYFDPNSAPFQHLCLNPAPPSGSGMAFGSYALK
mmetsp:Transcript_31669/g.70419  ORF Transcript_31669/g.70419 Transcript_31669/m.70419 type:complete len:301 (+) Transcript_31669:177-1079(+)|eukprot:CAMPEP_0202894794 /NCGR_PEP_ID=MMETSP1392-20130828/4104_1 /ASSEMBLY_ACC=CAM_ASM_000868 /TAXON_ID=225041 /ORGANISM="Chlamydomonas chlamydogama, Strain SAG 11-48b" /LENGTH=300 /DNA_ID=CAMNT_0049579585 /DNA_START=172 /DNA_END=1074 /DNA_ORIENTATION=-